MKKYAIFDLDGTILDSMGIWSNLGSVFLLNHGICHESDLNNKLSVMSLDQASEYLIKTYNMNITPNDVRNEIYHIIEEEYREKVQLKPFVSEYLEYLYNNGIKMCIATASDYRLAEMALKRLNIYKYFDFIFTCHEAGMGKDNPEFFDLVSKKLKADIGETMVYEDSLYAIKSAKAAGFYVVAVCDSSSDKYRDEIKENCNRYISSFEEMRWEIENGA